MLRFCCAVGNIILEFQSLRCSLGRSSPGVHHNHARDIWVATVWSKSQAFRDCRDQFLAKTTLSRGPGWAPAWRAHTQRDRGVRAGERTGPSFVSSMDLNETMNSVLGNPCRYMQVMKHARTHLNMARCHDALAPLAPWASSVIVRARGSKVVSDRPFWNLARNDSPPLHVPLALQRILEQGAT